jgi:hypothetical protein
MSEQVKEEARPTPGPLHIFKMLHPKWPHHWLVLTDATDERGAHTVVGETWTEANAKLWAAAPELLAALTRTAKDLQDLAEYHLPENHPDYDLAMAALQIAHTTIAKAEGRG